MTYLLDTSTCIEFLNRRRPQLLDRLVAVPDADLFLCSVVRAELLCGVVRHPRGSARRPQLDAFLSRYRSLPFDDDAAEHYAEIRAAVEGVGRPIGANDLLIAAIARSRGLVVVTHNVGEFERVPGLTVEDWARE
jgi:tRNA(fMet)-specific endonuclease VapC